MSYGEAAKHLLEDVVQVAARGDRLHIGLKPFLLLHGIHAMEVGIVEVGAFHSPYFVVHLIPLSRRVDAHLKIGERYRTIARLDRRIRRNDHICWTRGWPTCS